MKKFWMGGLVLLLLTVSATGSETVPTKTGKDKPLRELSPKAYWYHFLLGNYKVKKQSKDQFQIWIFYEEDGEDVIVQRKKLLDRKVKTKAFLDFVGNSLDFFGRPSTTDADAKSHFKSLERATGLKITSKTEWLNWWKKHRHQLQLSKSGEVLIVPKGDPAEKK